MPVYTDPDNPTFRELEQRHLWFARVLEVEYGEREVPDDAEPIPDALDWLTPLPVSVRYDFDEAECSLAFAAGNAPNGYACTVWDVSGENDLPWAVYLVDDYGPPRLLTEYSVLDSSDASDENLEENLRRAADELPRRLERGEFTRTGRAVPVPDWLTAPDTDLEDEEED